MNSEGVTRERGPLAADDPAQWNEGSGADTTTRIERPDTSVLVRQRLAENADDVDALFAFAAVEAREGRLAEGLSILDRVLRLDPGYPGGWRFKATLHRMNGDAEAERVARDTADGFEE